MARIIKSNGKETVVPPTRSHDAFGGVHQVRSYVLDRSVVKDLRTGHETSDVQAVLDGDIDDFMRASLADRIK